MLKLSSINLHLRFNTPAQLPYWLGSAFRGVFGREVRRALCIDISKECKECIDKENCLYFYIYEKPVAKRGHSPPQRPVILVPPFFGKVMRFENNGKLDLKVLFFGDFSRYAPHVLLALRMAGQEGIGNERYYNMNRFVIESGTCDFSKKNIYDGRSLDLNNLESLEIGKIKPLNGNIYCVRFRTPLSIRKFPPSAYDILDLIRNRLIRFVNEYGDCSKVPEFNAKGRIIECKSNQHVLKRRSSRSEKNLFKGYTGIVRYEYDEIDENGRWLLAVGNLIGCGPDSSFGLGFLNIE